MTARPTYATVAAALRRAILDQKYPPGAMLPAVRDIANTHQVAPGTALRSLRQLEGEGLVTMGPRGARVTQATTVPSPRDRLAHLTDTGRILPTNGTSRFIGVGQIDPGEDRYNELETILGMEARPIVWRRRLTLDHSGNPVALSTSYRRWEWIDMMPGFLDPTPLPDGGLTQLLAALNEPLCEGIDRYSARYPTTDEADILGCSATAPLLAGHNWWTTPSGLVCEYGESLYAPGKSVEYPYTR